MHNIDLECINFAFMKEILSEIRKRREKKRYSQEYVGEAIGLDRVRYGSIEAGKRELRLEEAMKIAQVLECSVSDFFQNSRQNYTASLDLPLKTVEEEDQVPIYRLNAENTFLKKQIELLENQLQDKIEIIELLKKTSK